MNEPDGVVVQNALNLWAALNEPDVAAVVARSVRVGPPPPSWTGELRAAQSLELEIEDVLCGRAEARTVVLDVPVVRDSRTSEVDEPRLARWFADPGARAVYLLRGDRLAGGELGVLPATDGNVRWIRSACGGPLPPGAPSLLYLVQSAAGSSPEVAAAFAPITSAVVDVVDGDDVARLTVANGVAASYTGVHARALARDRAPDHVLTRDELVRALHGDATRLPPELAEAFAHAGADLQRARPGELDRLARR
jgi:hypothetical protein